MSCICISKLVKKKTKAFELGTNSINELYGKLGMYVAGFNTYNEKDKFIGANVVDVTKYIYGDPSFYEYLKYSFIGKYYERRINLIIWLIILAFILAGVGLYFLLGMGLLFGILCVVLIIGLIVILLLIKTGEKYKDYYQRTFMSLLLNSFKNISFKFNFGRTLTEEEIDDIIYKAYDQKTTSNNINFTGNVCNGNVCDLKLVNETETRVNGKTIKNRTTTFDGFYIKINLNNNYNKLKGNKIKIKADENVFSSLTEDTVRGIYESDLEFNFNSEEMNKSFDCKVSGYNGFVDADDMLMQVHKIITPSFEQHLLYLRSRYNTFNMNITDESMTVSFHMDRSLFQKAKHKELLDFKTTYREANEEFRMLKPSTSGISDFAYYNVFPFMERLYLTNYLTYLYLSYMDFENYYDANNNSINSYEEQMKTIYVMENKEFRELYTDKIEQIKKDTKNNLHLVEIKER